MRQREGWLVISMLPTGSSPGASLFQAGLGRSVESVSEIPVVRTSLPSDLIGLIGDTAGLTLPHGIGQISGGHLCLSRKDPFPFEYLEVHLPRISHRTVVPELVQLIPGSSWFASLANLLVAGDWNAIKNPFIAASGGCEECGDPYSLEGHELWEYDEERRIQTLVSIRCLCSRCHATQHLGRANVIGTFDIVFDRLCRINRIYPIERDSYRDAIFESFLHRSAFDWELDISLAFDIVPHLALKSHIEFAGDNWIVSPSRGDKPEIAVRLSNAEIGSDGKRLFLLPEGTPLGDPLVS